MNKRAINIIFFFLLLIGNQVFSQKNIEIAVTGTVYISMSVAPGVMNGNALHEGPNTFRKQPIYFKNDIEIVKTLTDSVGVFSINLKEGVYTVYQEEGLKGSKDNLTRFGSDVIDVKKDGGAYKISFQNSSNRRSTMNSGLNNSGLPGSKKTKATKNTSEK